MSSWKNEGGNRVNNIVNAQTDITNKYFSTDPTLSVNDREGIYYNKENGATVLGIGTKNPYSRFSFGDYIENNYDQNILKSESLVNTPSIALSEKSDGTNATGISFFYNKAGSGDSRGIRFTVNNNPSGTIFNSSLEPQAISNDNTLMLLTNDGRTNSVLINTTSTNFANPKSGLEINGEVRATNGIILKELDANTIERQAGLIFYDSNDKKIKWCTGSGDDIKSVVATGESGFVIDTSKYDASFAVVENLATGTGVLAFKDMAFAIGSGTMLETKYVGTNQQNASFLKEHIPAFSIIGQTTGETDYNANMMLSHIDHISGEPILSGTSQSDLSMNGVLYLLNNLAIDITNPKSIIDVSKNMVPFLDIGYNNDNYDNSVMIGCDLSGSKQSLYFGENILNQGSIENKFNLFFGKDITNFGENNHNNLIFGNTNNINDSNSSNNLIFGNQLNIEADVSHCLVLGSNGTVNKGDLMIYFQKGVGEVFSVRNGGNVYHRGKLGIGTKNPSNALEVATTNSYGNDWAKHLKLSLPDGGNGAYLMESNNLALGFRDVNTQFYFMTNYGSGDFRSENWLSSVRMVIADNGNVGIGINDPQAKLHVSNSENQTSGNVSIRSEGTIRTYAFDADSNIRSEITNDNDGGKLQLYNGNTGSEVIKVKMSAINDEYNYINNGGKLGIGTDAPDEMLTVYGNIKAGGSGPSYIKVYNGVHDYVHLNSENGNGNIILKDQYVGDNNGKKVFISANGNTYFNGGNVGILTNNPSYALDISGTGDIFLQGSNQVIYFKDTNNLIARESDKITIKTGGIERFFIDNLGTTRVKGILSIDDLTIGGNPFDAVAASSWNSSYSSFEGISVNFNVGINFKNTDSNYRNFMPKFTLDVSGNIRGHNLMFGKLLYRIIPEKFITINFLDLDSNSITFGIYSIVEKNLSNTYPAWHLFDGDEATYAEFKEDSIDDIGYITMDANNQDTEITSAGAYVDIFLPKEWTITNYTFSYNENINISNLPKSWILLGKCFNPNDVNIDQNTNKWKLIDLKNLPTNWTTDNDAGVYKNSFSVGDFAYTGEKFLVIRLAILETYTHSASDDDLSGFVSMLSGFQIFGETAELTLNKNYFIQSSFTDTEILDENKDIVLQPYGNKVGIRVLEPEVILDISDNGAIRLPVGTTDEGNTLATTLNTKKGYIRFNTTRNQFEGYFGKNSIDEPLWKSLGGLIDADQNTYITPEETLDENSLKFYTNGVKRLVINDEGSFDLSANYIDISANNINIKSSEINMTKLDINNNLNVLADLSANKILSREIHLDDRVIRRGDIIKKTHPEDLVDDFFKLTAREGVFNVVVDEDEGYYIDDVVQPTIYLYPGSLVQFNLNLSSDPFHIYKDNTGTIDASGIVFVDENQNILSGSSANGQLIGTLFWHVPFNANGVYRYESSVEFGGIKFGGNMVVLPLASDISNNFVVTSKINTIDISGSNADFNDISNNTLTSNFIYSTDLSTNTLICNDKIGVGTDTPSFILDISDNGAIKLPVGDDGDRPTSDRGLIRYNSSSNQFEGCDGTNWSGLGGVISVDQQTYIIAQDNTVGQDEIGSLIFIVDNKEAVRIMGGGPEEPRYIGVNNTAPSVILDISDNGAIRLPVGTTSDSSNIQTNNKPGFIRFNSDKNQFEGFDGTDGWFQIGSKKAKIIDSDQDTYITVADDNTIRFYSSDVERMTIGSTGDVNVTENINVGNTITSDTTNTELLTVGSRIVKNSSMLKQANAEDTLEDFFLMKSNEGFFEISFDGEENAYNVNGVLNPTIYAYPGNVLEFKLTNVFGQGFRIYEGGTHNTTGVDVQGLMHISDKTITTDTFNNLTEGNLIWHVPFDAIGNYRYQSEINSALKGDIVILPKISDISSNHIVANELVIKNDLSGNNALLHDVSVNRLWIGQVEMIGYIPGNVANPMGLGELIGDFKVTGSAEIQTHTMLQTVDVSKNINLDYTNSSDNTTALKIKGNSGSSAQVTLEDSTNGMQIFTNNTINTNFALNVGTFDGANGTQLFRVNNDGNVGIGTANLSYNKLTINGSGSDTVPTLGLQGGTTYGDFSNGAQIAFGFNGTHTFQHFIHTRHNGIGNSDNAIDFYVCDSTENNTVTSGSIHTMSLVSGNVGIGIKDPQAKLHIKDEIVDITNKTLEQAKAGGITLENSNYFHYINIHKSDPNVLEICANGSAENNSGRLWFKTNDVERMIIDNIGNVGIGVTSPVEKLDISGVLHLRGGTVSNLGSDGGSIGIIDTTTTELYTNTYIRFDRANSLDDWAYLRQIGDDGGDGGGGKIHLALDFHDDDDDARFSIRAVNSSSGSGQTTSTKFIVLNNNVGIGTDDPSYKLDIQDTSQNSLNLLRLFSPAADQTYKYKNLEGYSQTSISLEKTTNYGGFVSGFLHQNIGSGLNFETNNGGTTKYGLQIIQKSNQKTSKVCIGDINPLVHLDVDPQMHYHLFFEIEACHNNNQFDPPRASVITQNGTNLLNTLGASVYNSSTKTFGSYGRGFNIYAFSDLSYDTTSSTDWTTPTMQVFTYDTYHHGEGVSDPGPASTNFYDKIQELFQSSTVRFFFIITYDEASVNFGLNSTQLSWLDVYGFQKLVNFEKLSWQTRYTGHSMFGTSYAALVINPNFNVILTGFNKHTVFEDQASRGKNNFKASKIQYYLTPENLCNIGPGCLANKYSKDNGADGQGMGDLHTGAKEVTYDIMKGNGLSRGLQNSTSLSILAPGENQQAKLFFGTQYLAHQDTAKKAAIIVEGQNSESRSNMHFCLNNDSYDDNWATARLGRDEVMTITHKGTVAIGTTKPWYLLPHMDPTENYLVEHSGFDTENRGLVIHRAIETNNYKNSGQHRGQFRIVNGLGIRKSKALEIALLDNGTGIIQANENSVAYNELHLNPAGGKVYVGTNSDGNSGLIVDGYYNQQVASGRIYLENYSVILESQEVRSRNISLKTLYSIATDSILITSDKRIKTNIVEVPDNLSLEKVRNIGCKYYEYIDKVFKGNDKTIGFIAQQVREHFPEAISITSDYIPNEYRLIEHLNWELVDIEVKVNPNNISNNDISNNDISSNPMQLVKKEKKYKLTIEDLKDPSNCDYKFYVSNSLNEEKCIETKCIDNNSFLFDNSWNNVFIYGKKVNDFHTLDKQKLFALNFSATQEIDRLQQEEKSKLELANQKITTLENKVITLEDKNKELENTLQEVLKRLSNLENN